MPEQKCLTIDGTQVLWKHYRKKQGKTDTIKLCIGPVVPEKQWMSIAISHEVVKSCTTTAALSNAVRALAAEAMNTTVSPPKDDGCCACQGHEK